jgi:hypothetical protein
MEVLYKDIIYECYIWRCYIKTLCRCLRILYIKRIVLLVTKHCTMYSRLYIGNLPNNVNRTFTVVIVLSEPAWQQLDLFSTKEIFDTLAFKLIFIDYW